jgi:hypothetical protein
MNDECHTHDVALYQHGMRITEISFEREGHNFNCMLMTSAIILEGRGQMVVRDDSPTPFNAYDAQAS